MPFYSVFSATSNGSRFWLNRALVLDLYVFGITNNMFREPTGSISPKPDDKTSRKRNRAYTPFYSVFSATSNGSRFWLNRALVLDLFVFGIINTMF